MWQNHRRQAPPSADHGGALAEPTPRITVDITRRLTVRRRLPQHKPTKARRIQTAPSGREHDDAGSLPDARSSADLQMPPAAQYRQADGQMWQECGRPRHETGNQSPIDRPNDLSRAPNAALEIRPSGRTPRGYFSSARKGGGVEQARTRTQTIPKIPGGRTRPNFLAKFFGKKFWK